MSEEKYHLPQLILQGRIEELISLIINITKKASVGNPSKCESCIFESQFGFRYSLGTRVAILLLQVLAETCVDMCQDVFICFIDVSKAFANLRHDMLMERLKSNEMDGKDKRLLGNI